MPPPWDWPQFQRDIHDLHDMSERLHDTWEIVTHGPPDDECSQFLRKQTKCWMKIATEPSSTTQTGTEEMPDDLSCTPTPSTPSDTLLAYEFHVLFHPSYRVPALYFNASFPTGMALTLDQAWALFHHPHGETVNMASVITEMHHPVLTTPFLALHPCRTEELLTSMPNTTNRVLTFLSTLGPAVNLHMDVRYGMLGVGHKSDE